MKPLAALILVLLLAAPARGESATHDEPPAGKSPTRAEAPPLQDYMLYSMGCHQRDGAGFEDRVPPLRGVDRFLQVPEGRAYLVRVPGVAHAGLSNRRLADLLNWVLAEFGTSAFEPSTEAEVGPLRSDSFLNPAAARKALLQRLAESNE